MIGESGDSLWEGGGGGGYSGGLLHVRSTSNASYEAGEGGSGFAGGAGVQGPSVVIAASSFTSRVPPATSSFRYSGVGNSGDAAIGYGGVGPSGATYGVECDSSGDGLVVISFSQ